MSENILQNLWVEKYRPKKLSDLVLPDHYFSFFNKCIEDGTIPNLMLCGNAGTGKTTLAKILIDEIIGTTTEDREYDVMILNGSDKNSVDVVRGAMTEFAKMPVMSNSKIKIIYIDEFDYSSNSQQAALRSFIEEYSNKCRFIFTFNMKHKIMDALFSRCQVFEFDNLITKEYIIKHIHKIVKIETGDEDKDSIIEKYVNKHYPDIRRIINDIQSKVINGHLIDDIEVNSKMEMSIVNYIKEIGKNVLNDNNAGVANCISKIQNTLNENTYSIDYNNLYDLLFNCEGLSFSSKIIITKYANNSNKSLSLQMNFMAMIFEIIVNLQNKKSVINGR